MAVRVIQWGAGQNGKALIRAVAEHPDLELVGCRVWSSEKNGVDAGVLAGIEPIGTPATTDAASLVATEADVVLFCPRVRPDHSESDHEICDLLRSGKNVISVTGAYAMPSAVGGGYEEPFEAACAAGKSTFASSGINPGFIAERLAPTLTGMCPFVEAISVRETYNCSHLNADVLFASMGFGIDIEKWTPTSPVGTMFNRFFSQVVHNLAHSLNVELAEVRWSAAVVPAHRDIELGAGLVGKGAVAAIVESWEGVPKDPEQVRITKAATWTIADDIPGYPVKSGWRIEIRGKPNVVAEIRPEHGPNGELYSGEISVGGAVNMIPEVLAAPPGFLLPKTFAPYRRSFAGLIGAKGDR